MYNDPLPQPLLVPWVDLTGISSLGGVTIPANSQKLYRSVFHAGMIYPLETRTTDLISLGDWSITTSGPVFKFTGTRSIAYTTPLGMEGRPVFTAPLSISTNQVFWVNTGIINNNYGTFIIGGNSYASPQSFSDICLNSNEISSVQLFDNSFVQYIRRGSVFLRFGADALTQRDQMGRACALNSSTKSFTYSYSQSECDILSIIPLLSWDIYHYLPIGFFPSRPLPKAPELIESITSIDHVTIGGRTYHSQHSRRKLWNCEILLDGGIDCLKNQNWYPDPTKNQYFSGLDQLSDGIIPGRGLDAVTGFDLFLKHAEKGVTLWVDRWCGAGKHIRPNYAVAFPGVPNVISGQLVNCSQVKLVYSDGLNRRYKVTLTIAEEDPY